MRPLLLTSCLLSAHEFFLPIIIDGVHPNKIMYARWGESVGEKLYQRIKPHLDLLEQKQRPPAARDSRVVDRLKQC